MSNPTTVVTYNVDMLVSTRTFVFNIMYFPFYFCFKKNAILTSIGLSWNISDAK